MVGGFSQIYRFQNGLHNNDYLPVVVENKKGQKFRLMWNRNTGEIQTSLYKKGDSFFPSSEDAWHTVGRLDDISMRRLRLQGAVSKQEYRKILEMIEEEVISTARSWAQAHNMPEA